MHYFRQSSCVALCCSYIIDLPYIPIVFHHSSCEAKPLVVMTGKNILLKHTSLGEAAIPRIRNGGRFRWKNGGLRWDFLVVSTVDHGWLVVWNMAFMTFHILGRIIPTDFHIFQRGWNHQPDDKLSSEHQVQDFRARYWSWLGDIPGLLRTRGKCIIQERFQIDGMWVRHFCPNCLEVTQTGVCCPDFLYFDIRLEMV